MPSPAAANRTLWLNASVPGNLFTTAGNPPTGTPSDGQAVQQWLAEEGDLSARYQTATGESPTFDADGINGLGALQFDGTDDILELRADDGTTARTLANFFTGNFTAWASFRLTGALSTEATNLYQNDGIICDASAYWGMHVFDNAGTPTLAGFCYSASSAHYVTTPIALNTNIVASFRGDGTNIYLAVQGGSETSVVSGNPDSVAGAVVLGASDFGGNFTPVRFGEGIVYNASQSGGDYATTGSYMVSKWLLPPNARALALGRKFFFRGTRRY